MGITLMFDGKVFKQASKHKTKALAKAKKSNLKKETHSQVRIKPFTLDSEGGKRKKGYSVWVHRP